MIDYTKYSWLDVQATLPESASSKEKEAKRLLDTLDKKDFMSGKKNILASYYFDQCAKYAGEDRLSQFKLDSNLSKDFKSWSKSNSFKKLQEQILQNEKGKFIMSGIVIVMTCTLTLFFLIAMLTYITTLTDRFLVNKWIDTIVGAVAMVFLYRNMKIKYRTIKRYTDIKDFVLLDVASMVLCFLLKIWIPMFDFSVLILFVAHYISKRKFDKVLDGFTI